MLKVGKRYGKLSIGRRSNLLTNTPLGLKRKLKFFFERCSYTTFSTGKFPLGIQNMKINETPIDMPDIDDKAQEMDDFETDLYQSSRDIKKLNKKKRKKVLSGAEPLPPPPKKAKLCKVDDTKLKKKKPVETDQWVETDLTPEEISVDVSNACPDQSVNGSADPDMENVINSTTGKRRTAHISRNLNKQKFHSRVRL